MNSQVFLPLLFSIALPFPQYAFSESSDHANPPGIPNSTTAIHRTMHPDNNSTAIGNSSQPNMITASIGYNTLHGHSNSLATISVTSNTAASGPLVITGTIYNMSSRYITLAIKGPKDNVVEISQIQPSSGGKFSLKTVPVTPLWHDKGDYTVAVLSGTQVLAHINFYFNGTDYRVSYMHISQIPVLQPTHVLPMEQFRLGVASKDITCGNGFSLVTKATDGSPACVRPDTAQMLVERGWAKTAAPSTSDPQLPHGPHPKEVDDWLAAHPHFFGCIQTDLRTGVTKEIPCAHPGNPVYGHMK